MLGAMSGYDQTRRRGDKARFRPTTQIVNHGQHSGRFEVIELRAGFRANVNRVGYECPLLLACWVCQASLSFYRAALFSNCHPV